MSKLDESVGFYRKMSDLQERLRRSEEERLHLEEKFALLMRACRDEEEARLNDLRERYEVFLEEEKQRRERNERILQTLDRIESRAAILTAKSERLRLLRRHYETYMLRLYPGWKYITDRFTSEPSIPKYDPLHNKFNMDAVKIRPYSALESTPVSFPSDFTRRTASPTLQCSHQNTSEPVLVSVPRVDITSSKRPIQEFPSVKTVFHKDTVQQIPPGVAAGKGAAESFVSGQRKTSNDVGLHELDNCLGKAAELLRGSNSNAKDTKQQVGNSVDFEQEQNTSGDLLNVSLSDDGVLQEETIQSQVSMDPDNSDHAHKHEEEGRGMPKGSVPHLSQVLTSTFQESANERGTIIPNTDVQLNKGLELTEPNCVSQGADVRDSEKTEQSEDNENVTDVMIKQQLGQVDQRYSQYGAEYDQELTDEQLAEYDQQLAEYDQHYAVQQGADYDGQHVPTQQGAEYTEQYADQQGAEYAEQYADQQGAEYAEQYADQQGAEYAEQYADQQGAEYAEQYADQQGAEYAEQYAEQQGAEYAEQYADQQGAEYAEQYADQQGAEYAEKYADQQGAEYAEQYADQQGAEYAEQYGDQQGAEYGEQYVDQQGAEYAEKYADQQGAEYAEQYGDQKGAEYAEQYAEQQGAEYAEQYADQQGAEYAEQYVDQQGAEYGEQYADQQGAEYAEKYADQQGAEYAEKYADQQGAEYAEKYAEQQGAEYAEKYADQQGAEYAEQQRAEYGEQYAGQQGAEYAEQQADQQGAEYAEQQAGQQGAEYAEKHANQEGGEYANQCATQQESEYSDQSATQQGEKYVDDSANQQGVEYAEQYVAQQESEYAEQTSAEQEGTEHTEQHADQQGAELADQQLAEHDMEQEDEHHVQSEQKSDQTKNGGNSSEGEQLQPLHSAGAVKQSKIDDCEAQMLDPQHGSVQPQIAQEGDSSDTGREEAAPVAGKRQAVKKLPGLTKMLESDTESLQLDATVSNAESDDFEFSSDK